MAKARTPAQLAADKKRTGRPPKESSSRQIKRVTIYLTADELERLTTQSVKEDISLSALIMRPWRRKDS
jgi:hypothetical protein